VYCDPNIFVGQPFNDWFDGTCGSDPNIFVGQPCPGGHGHGFGGWWPSRSAAVIWDSEPNQVYYYRAGDGDSYDLAYDPATATFNALTYRMVLHTYAARARASLTRAAVVHLILCEADQQDPRLTLLLAGFSLAEVANFLP